MINKNLINSKFFYLVLSCILTFSTYGCKEGTNIDTAFKDLPSSPYVDQALSSLKDKMPIAIAFTAEWCPHCKEYKPIFNEVKSNFEKQVTFINIDVDDEKGSALSQRFKVEGIPTTAFIRSDGSVLKVEVGELDKEKLTNVIKDLIANKKRKSGEPVAPFSLDKKIEEKKEEVQEQKEPLPNNVITPPPAPPETKPNPVPTENDLPPQELIKEEIPE